MKYEVNKRGGEFSLGRTKVIRNRKEVQRLFIKIVKSADHGILLIFPTINSFLREQRLGVISLLKYGAMGRGVNIKVLTPINNDVRKIVQGIVEEIGGQALKNFEVRAVDVTYEASTVNTVTIIIEKLDDSKENFIDAIGLLLIRIANLRYHLISLFLRAYGIKRNCTRS